MPSEKHYDVIIIGSGPGGGSVAHRLAPTGKRILMLERGDYLPSSRANWDAKTVFVDGAYQAPDTWYGEDGESFHPGLHYWVGGNSKVYGSALFRLREHEIGTDRRERGGIRAPGFESPVRGGRGAAFAFVLRHGRPSCRVPVPASVRRPCRRGTS